MNTVYVQTALMRIREVQEMPDRNTKTADSFLSEAYEVVENVIKDLKGESNDGTE